MPQTTFTKSAIQAVIDGLRADAAGNQKATMTDIDLAVTMLELLWRDAPVEPPKPEPVITVDTPVDYANDTIREQAQKLVQESVKYCVSSLIYDLSQNYDAANALGVGDDILTLTSREDWEEPARDHLSDLDAEGLANVAEYFDLDADSKLEDVLSFLQEEGDRWQELCRST